MRESRANLIIVVALIVIAGTLFFYASWLANWMSGGKTAAQTQESAAKTSAELAVARRECRADLLDPVVHVRLSEALLRAGRPVDSFYVLSGARALFGEEAFERAHALVVLYKEKHFLGRGEFDPSPANEERLKARLQRDPRDADAANYLAHIAASRRRPDEAKRFVTAGLTARPEDRGLLAYRAELLDRGGDEAGAIEAQAKLIAAHPGTHEARAALEDLGRRASASERRNGESAQLAREALEELLRARPEDPRIFTTLAMALWTRGDLGAVRALVAETTAKKPKQTGTATIEGALALQDREPAKAAAFFSASWERDPEDLYSAAKLAELTFKQKGDRDAALPYYLALYRANPRYDDGEPAEKRIRDTLDARREHLLRYAGPENLARYFESDDASLRAEAAARAAQLQDPRWIEALAALLDDDAETARQSADYALYRIAQKHPDAVMVRRDEWLSSDKPLVRVRALNLFADLDQNGTFPLVARALRDPVPAVRFFARVMVLDHYYKDQPQAARLRGEHLAAEKDPKVLGLYARLRAPTR